MRSGRFLRVLFALSLITPALNSGTALADDAPTVGATASTPAADAPEVPQFAHPAENQLVRSYLDQTVTAQQFVAQGIGVADQPAAADAAIGDTTVVPVASTDPDVPAPQPSADPSGAPAPTPSSAPAVTPSVAAPTAAPASAAAPAVADPTNLDPGFLQYVFAVAASEPAAAQQTLADALEPSNVGAPALSPAAATALAATAGTADCNGAPYRITIVGFSLADLGCENVSAHFHIYYNLKSMAGDGVPNTDVSGRVNNKGRTVGNGVPDYIDNVVASFKDAYGYYSALGYKTPPGPVTVLISSFDGAMQTDAGVTPPPIAGHQFILLSNEGSEIYLPHHELFHAFQYRYIATGKLVRHFPSMNWWMEATAEWAAHQSMANTTMASLTSTLGADEEQDASSRIPDFLGTPANQLNAWAGLGGARQYGAVIFAEYLSGQFGDAIILDSWQHIGRENGVGDLGWIGGTWPIQAIKESVQDDGSTLSAELPKFAKAAYQLGPDGGTRTICVYDTYDQNLTIDGTGGCDAHSYPVQVTGGGWPSGQFQFSDPQLPVWISWLAGDPRTSSDDHGAAERAPGNPRPNHHALVLNAAGKTGAQTAAIGPGGMFYADLGWKGTATRSLKVTVSAPKHTQLHASLISWTSYRTRCGPDVDVDVPANHTVTLQSLSLAGCSFATVVLTDTNPADSQNAGRVVYSWHTQFVDNVVLD